MKYYIGSKIYYIRNKNIEVAHIDNIWIETIPNSQYYNVYIKVIRQDLLSEIFFANELELKTRWHDKYYLTIDEAEIELFPF